MLFPLNVEESCFESFGSLRPAFCSPFSAAKYFKISCRLCRLSRQGKPGDQVNANLIDFSPCLEIENDTIKFKVGCVLSFDS